MKPLILIILDGWGLSPTQKGNAILTVPTDNFDQLLASYSHTVLSASGEEVGLSWGEMGNSEVGHLNLGTGRIIMQDLPRIDQSISDGTFFQNQILIESYQKTLTQKSSLHLIGLVSAGGVHSHLNHLLALLNLASKMRLKRVYIHYITDGRDTPPKIALNDLKTIQEHIKKIGVGQIVSLMGRYYAMDRDKHWDRTSKAYNVLFSSQAAAPSAEMAIKNSYQAGQTDEFIMPAAISQTPRIKDNDSIIFFNFRSDRAKQLTESIINKNFDQFKRPYILKKYHFVSFTNYGHEPSPNVKIAFFAQTISNQLAKIFADSNLSQLHIAETEKYAHVTYFFNGGQELPFLNEKRILVPSPKVATYDLKPEMSANEVTDKFLNEFQEKKPNFSIINFANPDMVGHTGVMNATQKAIIVVDKCLGIIAKKMVSQNVNLIITADHGNAEQMINPESGQVDKEHTTNPVPLILAIEEKKLSSPMTINLDYKINLATRQPAGVLADVTATCLDVLGIEKPSEITGQSLKEII